MTRPLRIEYPGAVYHVTSRGNTRSDIYFSDEDRMLFLGVLAHVVDRFDWICHSYCLMTNHYHLLIETPMGNLSKGMRQLNGMYTQRFNVVHDRVGHLFQGRYKAILVEKDSHLLSLCRYIVRNPVAAGMVGDVSEWEWSSYQAIAGLTLKPKYLSTGWVLDQFGGDQIRYRQFVAEGEVGETPLSAAIKSNILGGEQFRTTIQQKIKASAEVTRAALHPVKQALCELENDGLERGEWMSSAYREQGYTMREIADYAEVHYSLVSKLIKGWEERRIQHSRPGTINKGAIK